MTGKESLRIVLTGGVSGGHIYPLLAVAETTTKKSPLPVEFLFVGSKGKLEADAMAESGIAAKYVATGKWRRYFSLHNFLDLFKIPFGFLEALWHLLWFMPDSVFAKGGSASVPVVLAAWLYRIPVVLHESDAKPGAANKFLARFARRIALSYPGTENFFPKQKTALTGTPVRQSITEGSVADAVDAFGLHINSPIILFLGGSQGAKVLNEHLLLVLPTLLEKGYQVVHITGERNFDQIVKAATEYGLDVATGSYRPVPFLGAKPLADMYRAASVVVSRAGAGSIAELAANRKAVILVPLPTAANDHQRMNAYEVAEVGAAEVLEEANLTEHILLENIESIVLNQSLREAMGEKLARFYHPEAAEKIAVALLELSVA
jgi:UDP-N-acetylglucosamine--N-acetylmuramyl-(pentapeptide) pyrophosphoryl-undecaprenol N-acetylglucosamine transferase